ncbi:MAG: AAA family ATPase [Candidatus Bathyarchaeota archaeon]|nr:MAG: AAA family ATPase [Candidatus Bathyarchaeota archaeon]
MIITVHSYKGGTGKTLLSLNIAAMLANRDKKTCLLDLDFRAPSLGAILKTGKSEYWLNDYLNKACEIGRVLRDCSSYCIAEGKLFVGFANPSTEAIREMASKDRKWEMEALCRLLLLKKSLLERLGFDYVIFDTSPGLEYSSMNTIVTADFVFVVTTLDKSDVEGTQRMIREFYELFNKKTWVIFNKTLQSFLPLERKLESLQLPIVEAIPCSCDILSSEEAYFFASKKPNHIFTKTLQKIVSRIS